MTTSRRLLAAGVVAGPLYVATVVGQYFLGGILAGWAWLAVTCARIAR